MSYGDVAEFLGAGGPRQVGWVMSHFGSGVPWWRVLRADGTFLAGHEARALAAYRREGTPLRPAARGSTCAGPAGTAPDPVLPAARRAPVTR